MSKHVLAPAAFLFLTTAALFSATHAGAAPILPMPGSGPASDAVATLEAAGFDVQINWLQGHPNVPLRECRVTDIHNPNGPTASETSLSTVYVDISCPNAK